MGRKQAKLTGVFYNDKGKNFQQITEELFKAYIKSRQCGENSHERL